MRRTAPMPANLFNLDLDPNVRANREAKAEDQGLQPCTHCGRGVREGKGFVVVVIEGGSSVLHPDDVTRADETDSGFMGAWVLGSTCAKQIPADARKRWDGWS